MVTGETPCDERLHQAPRERFVPTPRSADLQIEEGRPPMKVRDLLRLLADDGWILVRTRGSHQQFKHPAKSGLVTLAGSGNDDLAPRTLNSILKQAGLKDRGQE